MYPAKIIVSVLGIVSKGTHKQDVVGWCCLGHGVDEIERVGIGPLDIVKKEYDDVSATGNGQQHTPPQLLEPNESLCGRSHVLGLVDLVVLGAIAVVGSLPKATRPEQGWRWSRLRHRHRPCF